jgi:hypothetical protein
MNANPVTLMSAVALLGIGSVASGSIMVNYTVDAGGDNPNPLNGMSASATFSISGNELTILLVNTSTGVPVDATTADSLLVSVGFNLVDGITITSGVSAEIGAGSIGIGSWTGLVAGDSVAEEWLWTNDKGGDLMIVFDQVISTSSGQNAPPTYSFVDNSANPMVNGPFGGITASPPILAIPGEQPAVSNSIEFKVMLSDTLTEMQLEDIALASLVEFGSDFQYLTVVPTPGVLALMSLAGLVAARPRRRRE